MEHRLGHDFSAVRVRTDPASAAEVQRLRAAACTMGTHIAFAPGTYESRTRRGTALLVRELVHGAQNASAPVTRGAPLVSHPSDVSERQAHEVTGRFMGGMTRLEFHPVRPAAPIGLVPQLRYRGYAGGAPPREEGWVRDLGDGHYFSDSPGVAEGYATLRAQGNLAARWVAGGARLRAGLRHGDTGPRRGNGAGKEVLLLPRQIPGLECLHPATAAPRDTP